MDQDVPQLSTLKKILKCVGAGGEKLVQGYLLSWTPLEMENSPSRLYHRGEKWWRKKRGGGRGRGLDVDGSVYYIAWGKQAPVL